MTQPSPYGGNKVGNPGAASAPASTLIRVSPLSCTHLGHPSGIYFVGLFTAAAESESALSPGGKVSQKGLLL